MKNRIYFLCLLHYILFFNFTVCSAQSGDWVWIKGSNVWGNPGHYGIQGIAAPANNPPWLDHAFAIKDLNGNFWLFGGESDFPAVYGDLWKYDPLTNNWTWMKGTGQSMWAGNYGTQGVSSPTNNPPCRHDGAMWLDNQGNIWMFGGLQTAATYSDLWKFDIASNEWTWVKGPNTTSQPGIFGTQGVPAPTNNPPAMYACSATWTDNAGDLWLLGGWAPGRPNILWRYNIASNQWTWMKGVQGFDIPSVFGTKGIEDSLNCPGGRAWSTGLKDINGNFWLFGGSHSNGGSGGRTNELWRFNPTTNNWTWMSGDSTVNSFPVHGTLCVSATTNKPESNSNDLASWLDDYGNLWFYEGINASGNNGTLWKYCTSDNLWTLQEYTGLTNWGTMGVSSPTNAPGSRRYSSSWKGNDGKFYFFGGSGYNDLWRYTVDSACGSCTPTLGLNELNYQSESIWVYPNPAKDKVTIKLKDFSMHGTLEICNMLGKTIFIEKLCNESEIEINVADFSQGIYFVKVVDGEKSYCRKLIVE